MTPKPNAWQMLVPPEEERRLNPAAPPWAGGYRWFRSANIVDLQHYRTPAEKQRIRETLLARYG